MLQIQVLGKGMIPRGYGLAPRKEFFKADLNLIQTILATPGLTVNMLNPETKKVIPVTKANVKTLWNKYRLDKVIVSPGFKPNDPTNPVIPAPVPVKPRVEVATMSVKATPDVDAVVSPVNVNASMVASTEKVEEDKPVEKVEVKKTEGNGIKPVINDNNKNNNQKK